MSHYKPYPEYKESGIKWIGSVPDHWELKPLKIIVSHNDDVLPDYTNPEDTIRYVDISSVNYNEGISKIEEMPFCDAPSRARRKAKSGDVILSTVRTYLKAVASVDDEFEDCTFSTGFAVLRPRHNKLEPRFLKWLVLNDLFIQAVEAHSEGLSYPAINPPTLVGLKAVIPGLYEQNKIADALETETARVDTLITKKTRFIELLKEKRQALITHAVTKGLNPDIKMKDSGVEWIGEIPLHWNVKPLKYVVSCNDDLLPEATEPETEIRYVDISSVSYEEGICSAIKLSFANAPSRARRKSKKGDVIVSTVRTYLKAVASVSEEFSDCVFSTGFAVLRSRPKKVNQKYLQWLVLNELFIQAVAAHSEGLSYPAINAPALISLKVAIPSISEQAQIVSQIDRETNRIDMLIRKTKKSIDLLKERRSAFITAAVTGQIDLRGEPA